jgi:hypothetical protein
MSTTATFSSLKATPNPIVLKLLERMFSLSSSNSTRVECASTNSGA